MAAAATLAISLVARTARFERSMKRSARSVRRMRKDVSGLSAAAAVAVAPIRTLAKVLAPLAAGAGFISLARGAESFNQAMRSSQAIMGDLSETMKATMGRTAIEVAKTTKFSGKQAAESFFFLASAGLDAAQSIAALPKVAQFAQAGMFDMALATDLLTDAQSALGLTVKDPIKNLQNMARVADVLVKANTLANASVQQFSEALTSGFAAELKAFNIDIEEGVAVLAAFADRGKKSAEASTLASQTLRVLANTAIKNAAAYEKLNISVFDSTGNLRRLADIVEDVSRSLGVMSDRQKTAALSQLGFTIKVQTGIKTLLGAEDQIRKYEKALRAAGGTTKSVSDNQLTAFAKAMARLTGSWLEFGKALRITDRLVVGIDALSAAMDKVVLVTKAMAKVTFDSIPTWAKWSVILGTASSSILGIIRLAPAIIQGIKFISIAIVGMTKRMVALISLGGPAAWAQLAGAVAITVGTVASLNAVLGDTVTQMDAIVSEAQQVAKAAEAVAALDTASKGTTRDTAAGRAGLKTSRDQGRLDAENKLLDRQNAVIDALRKQVTEFGLAGAALDQYKLRNAGASEATMQLAASIRDQLSALEKQQEITAQFTDFRAGKLDFITQLQRDVNEFEMTPMQRELENFRRQAQELLKLDPGAVIDKTFFRDVDKLQKELATLETNKSAQSFVDRLQADIEEFDLSFLDKQLKDLQRQGADPAILAEAQRLIAQLEGLEKDRGTFADAARGPQRGQFEQVKLSRLASNPVGSDRLGKDPQLNQVNAQLAQIVTNTAPQPARRAP